MNKVFKKIQAYSKLPEMRPSWYFAALAVAHILVAWTWVPFIPALLLTAGNVALIFVFIYVGAQVARTNFALKLEKNQNAAIVAGFAEGIIAYDQNFKIWSMNQPAEVICGVRKDDVLGKTVTPEWGADPRYKILIQILFPSLAPVVTKKSVASYPQIVEVSFVEPREMHLEITTNQIFEDTGTLLGFLKVVRDRSREVELLRAKSEFLTVTAHQLRTPLSGLKWATESFVTGDFGKLAPEQDEVAQQILRTTEKLIKMVDDMLDLAKIEEGKFGYEFEKSDLVSLIQETLEQYQDIAKEKNVHLVFYKPEVALPLIVMDRRRMSLVLQNLVANGIKYNVKNGEVRLRVEALRDRPYVQVSVEDTGIGIPEKDLSRLFSKFFRAENAIRVETEGSGLGLYIVRNVIKRHGGDIWIKSTEKRGTTITFVIPTDEALIPPSEIPTHETF